MKKDFFQDGPFSESRENAMNFGMGIYFYYGLQKTLESYLETEQLYQEAVAQDDKIKIIEAARELKFSEDLITLTTAAAPALLSGSYDVIQ